MLHAVFLSVTVLILGELTRRKRAAGKAKAPQSSGWRPPGALLGVLGAVLTFALMSFSQIFFHSETFGEATSILAQVVGAAPSGPTGWSDMPAYLSVPAWICMGVALYVGAGRRASEVCSDRQPSRPKLAAVRRLPVPAVGPLDRGKRAIHLWTILASQVACGALNWIETSGNGWQD